ncbi:hypothetical protein [Shouchella lonarensis]|uniref:DUF3918 domain-containing protein n=1 Tax=Shouchella lonarensis TaxID=1464122 RepID=A0A1G6JL22_9BACI|nr:hypothetical protein [Shouchella lonarensis]SDC19472.1 hypothetical protein SAMN05421737_10624 [Shouchella lonarensis]
MKKAMTPLVVLGLGAAWYSMSDKKTKRKMQHVLAPVLAMDRQLMDTRVWKKAKKKLRHMFR